MTFEDEPKPIVQEASVLQNTFFFSQAVNFSAEKSFILHSLQRIKMNTICEIRKRVIDNFITEYFLHFSGFVKNHGSDEFSEDHTLSPLCVKQSYDKVIKEQEYLGRIMNSLTTE